MHYFIGFVVGFGVSVLIDIIILFVYWFSHKGEKEVYEEIKTPVAEVRRDVSAIAKDLKARETELRKKMGM